MEKDEKKKPISDPILGLDLAIQNLANFTDQNQKETTPLINTVEIKSDHIIPAPSTHLTKTIGIISSLFPAFRQKHQLAKRKVKRKLIQSIEYLKTHYRIIRKLQKGTKSEQEWANRALETIKRYNAMILNAQKNPTTIPKKVAKFVYEKIGLTIVDEELCNHLIEIPHDFSLQFDSLKKESSLKEKEPSSQRVASFFKEKGQIRCLPTQKEVDIFHMKTITVAKQADLPPGLSKALNIMMWDEPISATFTEISDPNSPESAATISMTQTITPLPGEKIKIEGQIKRDAKSLVSSIPDPESFRVSTDVKQTGFPHPSQYDGLSLSPALLPDCPLRFDLLPLYKKLFDKKEIIANNLLPGGIYNEKAKMLLLLRKHAFEEIATTLLNLHKKEIYLILSLANSKELSSSQEIDNFFDKLLQEEQKFHHFTTTNQLMIQLFIEEPYNLLQNEWQDKLITQFPNADPKQRVKGCLKILEQQIEEAKKDLENLKSTYQSDLDLACLNYMQTLGYALGSGAKSLILQQFSEKLGFAPPLLTDFEQKLQCLALKQLVVFQEELQQNYPDLKEKDSLFMQKKLKNLLEDDIAFLQSETPEVPQDLPTQIAFELERYYNSQYNVRSYWLYSHPD